MLEGSGPEVRQRQAVVDELARIGVRGGVLRTLAEDGQLIKLQCETPKCYCDEGRRHFPKPPVPNSPWGPTIDHHPILKTHGGQRSRRNVRLAHKLCNNEDFAWRERVSRMLEDRKSLNEIAAELNHRGIPGPKGAGLWTAASVRWTFVNS